MSLVLSNLILRDSEVVEIWQILAQDAQLTTAILEHFLELLQKSLPYEEKADPRDKTKFTRTATAVPLAVSVCVHVPKINTPTPLPLAVTDVCIHPK